MNLKEYFNTAQGTGIMATASTDGKVDAAVYSRPHVMENPETLAFIMRDRLIHSLLQSNNNATYVFLEDGPGYQGVRLFLKKTGEEENPELVAQMTRRHLSPEEDAAKGPKFIVYFAVEKILPLIGSGEEQ